MPTVLAGLAGLVSSASSSMQPNFFTMPCMVGNFFDKLATSVSWPCCSHFHRQMSTAWFSHKCEASFISGARLRATTKCETMTSRCGDGSQEKR